MGKDQLRLEIPWFDFSSVPGINGDRHSNPHRKGDRPSIPTAMAIALV